LQKKKNQEKNAKLIDFNGLKGDIPSLQFANSLVLYGKAVENVRVKYLSALLFESADTRNRTKICFDGHTELLDRFVECISETS